MRRPRRAGIERSARADGRPARAHPREVTLDERGARTEAYRVLARSARSSAEIRTHLERRGFAPAHVDAAIAALTSGPWLDDAALAKRRAAELMVRRGWGRLRVAFELTRRGFADTVITTAIDAVHDEQSETELASRALRRKFPNRSLLSAVDRARAFRYLTGRGHPVEIVTHVLGEALED